MVQIVRVVRVELPLDLEEETRFKDTLALYSHIYGEYATWMVENQTTNTTMAHRAIYANHKAIGLPTALIQAARDTAAGALKTYNANHPTKKWSVVPRHKGRGAYYNARSVNLRGNLLTFSSANGRRIRKIIQLPEWFLRRYPELHSEFKSADIGYDRQGKIYANLTYVGEKQPKITTRSKIVGIDRGVRVLAYTSEGVKYTSKELRAHRRKHLYTRSQLQKKGTRSAMRLLKTRSGREERYVRDVNHRVSKELASAKDVSTYVLENLSRSLKRNREGGAHSRKRLSDWSHGQLLWFIQYKCEANGIEVGFVNPAFTSQDCNRCGARSKEARRGSVYSCKRCGLKIHSDLNAAFNIRNKWLWKQQTLPEHDLWAGRSQPATSL